MRRRLGTVSVLLVATLAGCTDPAPEAAPAAPRGTPEGGRPTDASSGPTAVPYRAHPAEIDGAVKRTAARAVEALPEVLEVTYTQYFGYQPPAASILVEADFVDGGGATYEVLASRSGDQWRVDSVTPASAVSPLPDPGRLIRRVLDSDRIELPWAGRADVAAGLVSDAVLQSLLAVAKRHRVGVSVLISPHPVLVFGTDRRSHHPDGLAYDIGSIDGRLVVDPGAAELVHQVMRAAAAAGATQVGGPVDLDAGGSQYFSDPTHSDHVHVGLGQ